MYKIEEKCTPTRVDENKQLKLFSAFQMMHPILEQVKEVLGDRIRIIKVDVDKYGVTAKEYGIQSVPTLMLFRHGEVLWRTSGVVQRSELLATIDPFLR